MCRFCNPQTRKCTCKADSHGCEITCKICTLYQTETDYLKSFAKAKARFLSLPKETQFYYIQTYYGGINPYKEREE